MKIAFWGNACNNFYAICKVLKASNFDCHLYLPANADIQNLPESEDSYLKNNYPNWIHKNKDYSPEQFFYKRSKVLINELNKYEIVVLSGRGISLTPYIKSKTIFYVTGSDLTLAPFYNRQTSYKTSYIKKIGIKIFSFIQKKGIKNASQIWTQPFKPLTEALDKLKVDKAIISHKYFPLAIDAAKFSHKSQTTSIDRKILKAFQKYKFAIFHPSRLMMKKDEHLVAAGQWKQNELLLYGLKKTIDTYNTNDIGLVVVDRWVNDFEKEEFVKIIKNLQLEDYVSWIKPKNHKGFTKEEMIDLYSLSSAVVDEFGVGWFGSIVVEAAACSKPVICYVDEKVMEELYEWHPIISTNTTEGLSEVIYKLYSNKRYYEETAKKSREWVVKYHSLEAVQAVYLNEFKQLINE